MSTPMPLISIAELKAETATVTVETSLGTLIVDYLPNALTPLKEAQLARLSASADEDDDAAWALAELFCSVVNALPNLGGPLVDDDGHELVPAGEVVPVVPENMVILSSRVMSHIFTAIQEAMTEDAEKRAKPTRNGARPSRKPSRRGSFDR